MRKKTLTTLFCAIVLAGTALGQPSRLIMPSADEKGDARAIEAMQKRMKHIRETQHRPTVGLVLEGGGAKGSCHVGALRYIEEMGIPIDVITGTSMGGLMGGLYSLGYSAEELDSIVRSIDWDVMMSDQIPARQYSYDRRRDMERYILRIPFGKTRDIADAFINKVPDGYLQGINVNNTLSALSVGYHDEMDFKDLPIPFFCVATEMLQMKEKNWTHGILSDAMRSTMSIPFYFKPVRKGKGLYVDGGTSNNFPVDLAKAMGADIIIGVNINHQDRPDDMNISQIALESILGMGRKSKEENLKQADILIQPDLAGYGMLSFSDEAISTLIANGYAAAAEHKDEFEKIAALVGKGNRRLGNRKATNLTETPVLINGIEMHGMTNKESRYFNGKIQIEPGKRYSREEIETISSEILSTGAFESVKYRLSGKDEPYRLTFDCSRGPVNCHSFGIRVDSEELLSAIVDFGIHKGTLYGWRSDVTVKLGSSPYLNVDFGYLPIKGAMLGMTLKTAYSNIEHITSLDEETSGILRLWHNSASIYIKDYKWSRVDLVGGLQIDYDPWRRTLLDDGITTYHTIDEHMVTAFGKVHFNSLDDGYFPTRGVKVGVEYEYLLTGKTDGEHINGLNFLSGNLCVPISIGSRLTFIPSAYFRGIFGEDDYGINKANFIGGYIAGRYLDQQIPFAGINGVKAAEKVLVSADARFRFKLNRKLYASLVATAYSDADFIMDLRAPVCAAGLQLDYRSLFGPFTAGIYWNDHTRKVNAYLGFGMTF